MTYEQTLTYLFDHLPYFKKLGGKALKKGSKNIVAVCEALGNPQSKFKSVHVAGTNGKGSSSHMLAAIFQVSGYKTGLYTSPHLKDYRERFKINGQMVPEEFVVNFVAKIKPIVEKIEPSFFELSVALAFDWFATENVDVAVIEVGLGGRFDATNVITPELSLITNIGFDHKDILGDTISRIAFEKGGIIKQGVPVVISELLPETSLVFNQLAAERNADLYTTEHLHVTQSSYSDNKLSITYYNTLKREYLEVVSELPGLYQQMNCKGVLQASCILSETFQNITKERILEGISKTLTLTGLKGRWQVLQENPLIICDTGHNKEAFQQLIPLLASLNKAHYHYLLAFSGDKDSHEVLQQLPGPASFYFTSFESHRSLKEADYEQLEVDFTYFANVNIGLSEISSRLGEDEVLFIGGSTYLVSEINEL